MALTPTRTATAATWASFTGTLANGEVTLETDTGVVKVGDGITSYAKLPVADNQITSAARAAIMSDETGTGAQVYGTSPTFITPILGVASATSITSSGVSSAINFDTGYSTTATAAATTTLTAASNELQFFTGSTTQTVVLPVASTIVLGRRYYVRNNSTGVVTVQSSGLNTIFAMPADSRAVFTCILASGTSTASWSSAYVGFGTLTGAGAVVLGTSPTIATPTITGVIGENGSVPTIASATTIAPTTSTVFVSGVTTVATITAPAPIATAGGHIRIIPTGIFLTNTAGNIALASTSIVNKTLTMTYDPTTAKFYPSY